MKAIFDDRQWKHQPKHFMANGAILPNPEQAERIDILLAGARAAGCEVHAPDDAGLGPISDVLAEYLYPLAQDRRRGGGGYSQYPPRQSR